MKGPLTACLLATLLAVPRAAAGPADELPPQLRQDPIGELRDVTLTWRDHQPAAAFCIRPDGLDAATAALDDDLVHLEECPVGYVFGDDAGAAQPCPGEDPCYYKVEIETPEPLATSTGFRRLFLDFTTIPADNVPFQGWFWAHGHFYFRLDSDDESYTVDATHHSPNIKNVTNDKLFVPDGSAWHGFAHSFDRRAKAYVGDTRLFHHSGVQGPYYVGPGYVSAAGQDVRGAYLDVQVVNQLPEPGVDHTIGYWAGFDSGETFFDMSGPFACPNNNVPGLEDANALYAGCFDRIGHSDEGVDPFA